MRQGLDIDFLTTGDINVITENILGSSTTVNEHPEAVDALIEYALVQGYNQFNLRGTHVLPEEQFDNPNFTGNMNNWFKPNSNPSVATIAYDVNNVLVSYLGAGTANISLQQYNLGSFIDSYPSLDRTKTYLLKFDISTTVVGNGLKSIGAHINIGTVASGTSLWSVDFPAGSAKGRPTNEPDGTWEILIEPSDWVAGHSISLSGFQGGVFPIVVGTAFSDSYHIDNVSLKEYALAGTSTFNAEAKLKLQDFIARCSAARISVYNVISPSATETNFTTQAEIENCFDRIKDYNDTRASSVQRFSGIIMEIDWSSDWTAAYTRARDAMSATWLASAWVSDIPSISGGSTYRQAGVSLPTLIWRIGDSKSIGYEFENYGDLPPDTLAYDQLANLDSVIGARIFAVETGAGEMMAYPFGYEFVLSSTRPDYADVRTKVWKVMADTGALGVCGVNWNFGLVTTDQAGSQISLSLYASGESSTFNRTGVTNTSYNEMGYFLQGKDHTLTTDSAQIRNRKDAMAVVDYVFADVKGALSTDIKVVTLPNKFYPHPSISTYYLYLHHGTHVEGEYSGRTKAIADPQLAAGGITYEDLQTGSIYSFYNDDDRANNPMSGDAGFVALYPYADAQNIAYPLVPAIVFDATLDIDAFCGVSMYSQNILRQIETLNHAGIAIKQTYFDAATSPLYSNLYVFVSRDTTNGVAPYDPIGALQVGTTEFPNWFVSDITIIDDGLTVSTTSFQWDSAQLPLETTHNSNKTFTNATSQLSGVTLTNNTTPALFGFRRIEDQRTHYPIVGSTPYNLNALGTIFNVTATPAAFTAEITETTSITCGGDSTADLLATPTFGTPAYTYEWFDSDPNIGAPTPISTSSTLLNVPAGQYWVVITDSVAVTAEDSIVITEPPAINMTTDFVNDVCQGAINGSFSVNIFGGTGEITILVDNGDSATYDPDLPTSPVFSGLAAGTYVVTATDENGCTETMSVVIASQSLATPTIVADTVLTTCSNSEVVLSITPAQAALYDEIQWYPSGDTNVLTQTVDTDGDYWLIGTSGNCTVQSNTITLAAAPPLAITATTLDDVICGSTNTGSLTATVTGGCPPYTFFWTYPSGATSALQTISNLSVGDYTILVTDTNLDTANDTATVSEVSYDLTIVATNETCAGANTGTVDVSPNGGSTPYTFAFVKNGSAYATNGTGQLNNLGAGGYEVTVTDGNGCSSTDTFVIGTPSLVLSATIENESDACAADGSITLTASGGAAPYVYSWSNGETTANITGLTAGEYTIVVTDDEGCSGTDTYLIEDEGIITEKINGIDCAIVSNTKKYITFRKKGITQDIFLKRAMYLKIAKGVLERNKRMTCAGVTLCSDRDRIISKLNDCGC